MVKVHSYNILCCWVLTVVLCVSRYLWFFIEPIMVKADNFSFLKKLIENIKQTKDAQAPEDDEANHVLNRLLLFYVLQCSGDACGGAVWCVVLGCVVLCCVVLGCVVCIVVWCGVVGWYVVLCVVLWCVVCIVVWCGAVLFGVVWYVVWCGVVGNVVVWFGVGCGAVCGMWCGVVVSVCMHH